MQYLMNRRAPQMVRDPTELDLLDPNIQQRIEQLIK
jgi:hypothetical protein